MDNYINGSVAMLLESGPGRIFGLDVQLLFDAAILAFNIFLLFILLSYLLFNPVREMLKKRQDKITHEREQAKTDMEYALELRDDYETKLRTIEKEAESILAEARKKALNNREEIISKAKDEASAIVLHASNEVELEKRKAIDDIKKEIIMVSTMMAGKIVSASIDEAKQDELIEDAIREMGDKTWLS